MVSSTERRAFLRRAASVVVTGLASPLISCTTPRPTAGRFYAYSRAATASSAGASPDEVTAIRSAFSDLGRLNGLLEAGDTVVFPDDHYPLEEPVRLRDGVRYRAATGASSPPVLDARGRIDHCMAGSGSRDIGIAGLRCVNARKNGIDITADPSTGRLPANVAIRACECSNNGRGPGDRPGKGLRHEEGNGIAIHSGAGYRTRLESTTAGIVVEDCEAHENLHAGILIDLPGVGHRISRCRAGGNGREAGTNAWGILIRPPGGAMLKGWAPSGDDDVWHASAARFRYQVPVRIVCTRTRQGNRSRWNNQAWSLERTNGDQRRPGRGQFGYLESAPRHHPELFVNAGPVRQFRPVICWIGDCRQPLIEDCTAWGQGGRDGVGIGFDQNTIDGEIRNCVAHDNKAGISLHINRGGTLADNVAFRNREYGFMTDRNLGNLGVAGNTGYENGLADFYFAVFAGENTRLNLAGNRASSATGYLGNAYDAELVVRAGGRGANSYCGGGQGSKGLPAFRLERTATGCQR